MQRKRGVTPAFASCTCALVRGRRALAAVGVDARVAGEDHLRDGDDGIPVGDECLNDAGQRLRCVLGRVVEQHDAARLHAREHARGDLVAAQPLPVERIDVPLDDVHAQTADGAHDRVVILPVGAAKQRGPRTGDGFDFIGAGVDLRLDLLGAQLRHVRVRGRVVHDLVARVRERLDRLRIFVHPFAHDEERRVDVVLVENVDEHLRILVAPGRVERQAHDAVVALHAVDGQHALGRAHAHDRGTVDRPEHERDGQHHRAHAQQLPVFSDGLPHFVHCTTSGFLPSSYEGARRGMRRLVYITSPYVQKNARTWFYVRA